MQSRFGDVLRNASGYIRARGGDPSGIEKWESIINEGFNPKAVGFLYLKGLVTVRPGKDYEDYFDDKELTQLYNDFGEKSSRNVVLKPLTDSNKQALLRTLFNYATVLGRVTVIPEGKRPPPEEKSQSDKGRKKRSSSTGSQGKKGKK